jgi:uncharacterized protein (UPF0332 family)
MTARDFLDLAGDLLAITKESAWRSAVSRAYYAAFHTARELLARMGFQVPRADHAHAYLWLRLSNCGDPTTESAGQLLRDLRRERNRADYELAQRWVWATARLLVQRCEDVIQTLEAAALEPIRSAIQTAMRDYERNVLRAVTWQPPPP